MAISRGSRTKDGIELDFLAPGAKNAARENQVAAFRHLTGRFTGALGFAQLSARLRSVLPPTEPPASFREALIAKTQLAHRVRASYEIFWGLASKETRASHGDLLDSARYFFGYTLEAHLAYVVVGLSRFFDTDQRSLSLPNLRTWAVREGFRNDAVRRSKDNLRPVSDRVKRLVGLRNTVYAHRSIDVGYREAFAGANLKYDDLFAISDAVLASLNELRVSIGLQESEYSTSAGDDTRFVLGRLASE